MVRSSRELVARVTSSAAFKPMRSRTQLFACVKLEASAASRKLDAVAAGGPGQRTSTRQADPNFFAPFFPAHFDTISCEHLATGQHVRSACDIILPTMPRAGQTFAIEFALRQRSPLVCAHRIDRKHSFASQEHGDHVRADHDLTVARSQIRERACKVPVFYFVHFSVRLAIRFGCNEIRR